MIKLSDLTKDVYKPGEVGAMLGVTTATVQNYCNRGQLRCEKSPTGRRLIPRSALEAYLEEAGLLYRDNDDGRVDIVYARVSTHKQKNRGDLDRQRDKLLAEVATKNPKNLRVVTEVGSGLNDKRRELTKIISLVCDKKVDRIFVLYKDRLTRFGFNYLKLTCELNGATIVVVSDETTNKTIQEELAEDIIAVIHSFSGKLYQMRSKVADAVEVELRNDSH